MFAQLDRSREETEHGDQDRHLDQHGDTSAHGVDARFFVELHRRLLFFHGVLLLGVFLVELVHLRFYQAHLCHRNVTLVREGRDDEFHQDHQDQDNDAEAGDIVAQEVEDRDHAPAVHPAEDTPSQRDQALHVQFLAVRSDDLLEDGVFVRAEIECEIIPFGLHRIGHGHLRRKTLQQFRTGSRRIERQVGVGDILRGDERRRKELLLESHPVDRCGDALRLGFFAHPQILDRALAREPVRNRRVHVLVLESLFVLVGIVRPVDTDRRLVGHLRRHIHQPHVEVHEVVALGHLLIIYKVLIFEPGIRCHGQAHHHPPGIAFDLLGLRPEDIVHRVDLDVVQPVLHVERKVEPGTRGIHQLDQLVTLAAGCILGIILERHARDPAAAGRKGHDHHIVLDGKLLRLRVTRTGEVFAQRSDLLPAYGIGGICRSLGRSRIRSRHGRTVGYGNYGARRSGHRILIGLIRGHFLLIFLLLFGIEIGEPQEKRRHDDNT